MSRGWTGDTTLDGAMTRHRSMITCDRFVQAEIDAPCTSRLHARFRGTVRFLGAMALLLATAGTLSADGVTISFDEEGTKEESSSIDGVTVEVVGPNRIKRGAPADYRITVRNQKQSIVENVVIEANLSSAFSVTSSAPQAETIEGGLVWRLPRLEGMASTELTFSAKASSPGPARVTAFARQGTKSGVEQALPVSTDPPRKLPELQAKEGVFLELTGPERTSVGRTFTIEALITNNGTKVLENGGFSINLTQGLKMAKAPEAGAGPLRIEVGENRRIPLEIIAETPGVHGIRAKIDADGGVSAKTEREITVGNAEFQVALEAPVEHVMGVPLKFRMYIANNRDKPASDVQGFIQIPEGIDVVSAEAGALFNRRTRTVRWKVGTLEPNEERGFRITVRPLSSSEVEFVASAQTAEGESSKSSKKVNVIGHAALGVTVEPSLDVAPIGEKVVVTFDVRSRGTEEAKQVQLKLETLASLSLDAEQSSGWSEADGWWVYQTPKDLPPGQSFRAIITLKPEKEGDFLLRANVSSKTVPGEIVRTQPLRVVRTTKSTPVPSGT